MKTNITHKGERLETADHLPPAWWVKVIIILMALGLGLVWVFIAFHFTVKMTIWYAKVRGWL